MEGQMVNFLDAAPAPFAILYLGGIIAACVAVVLLILIAVYLIRRAVKNNKAERAEKSDE